MKSISFRKLWIGQSIANLGDVLYIVSLIAVLYEVTSSALYLTLLPFLNMLGRFISSFYAPIIMNRMPLVRLLYRSQFLKTVILFKLSLVLVLNLNGVLWFILVAILFISFFDGWAMPAMNAMLPRLVEEQELVKANSFVSVLYESIQLGGWAVGGLLISILEGSSIIWLTLLLYGASTLLMAQIKDPFPFKKQESNHGKLDEILEVWRMIWRSQMYRSIYIVFALEAIANVVWIAAIMYVFVEEVLQVSEVWWGYINTSFFIGMIIAGIMYSRWSGFLTRYARGILLSTSFGVAGVTLIFGFNSIASLALLLSMVSGLLEQLKGITLNTYLQKSAAPVLLPKLYSVLNVLVSIGFGLATLLFGFIAEVFHVQMAFGIAGVILLVAACYLFLNRKQLSSEI